jgi:hypothetical protein
MPSHQTDGTTQTDRAGLSEQELALVSGGQLTPEDIQTIELETRNIMKGKANPMDPKTLGSASLVGTMAGFGAHTAGEESHKKLTSHH